MAARRDYFYLQEVQESELDAGFAGIEQALWDLIVDLGLAGIASGVGVVEHNPTPDLTVDVAIGTAYDQQGRRMRVPSLQVLNLAVDSNAVSTAVVNPGQSKILSLFLKFKRNESDPRTDGNGDPVNFVQDEGFQFFVVQGAESVSPSAPGLISDGILLADITRTFGQTQILNGNISTTRRQFTIQISAGAFSFNIGTVEAALQSILTALNNHITGVSNKHPASAIDYAGGPTWADTSTNPAATVEAQLDKIISDLSGNAGAAKIGYTCGQNWKDATTISAATVKLAIDEVVSTLAAVGGTSGALKIGSGPQGGTPDSLSNGSIFSQLQALLTAVNGRQRLGYLLGTNTAMSVPGTTVFVRVPALTTNRTWTVQDGQVAGDTMCISRNIVDNTNVLTILRATDSQVMGTLHSGPCNLDLVWTGSRWIVARVSGDFAGSQLITAVGAD